MTNTPSPLSSLRHALASSETDPQTIAIAAAGSANSNASHNTYLTLTTIESLQRTERLPGIFADAQNRPSLYGIPISIKDCFDLTGTTTSCGSRFYQQLHPVAEKNSWVAQRLLDAGAIIPGKTHLHQLAYGITGENADYGDCVQPRDSTLLTGGSSSGAAASVQEGSALAAIGTDTGGSVRVPAALCGLAGYRASHGVSHGEERWSGAAHLAPSFDTLGLLFRDLRDGPALASAIYDIPSVTAPTQLRIGYVGEEFTHDCEPEVLAAFAAWKQHLTGCGARLTAIDTAFWADSLEIFASIQASEAAQLHRGTINTSSPRSQNASPGERPSRSSNSRLFAGASKSSAPVCRRSSNKSTSSCSPALPSANSSQARTNRTSAKRSCATPHLSALPACPPSLSLAKPSVRPSALACSWLLPPCRTQRSYPSPPLSQRVSARPCEPLRAVRSLRDGYTSPVGAPAGRDENRLPIVARPRGEVGIHVTK